MAETKVKAPATLVRKKATPAARLTQNDKKVMKRAHLLRGTTGKPKKESNNESTDKSTKQ